MVVLFQGLGGIFIGVSYIQGYIEWHLSNVVTRAATAEGITDFEVIIVAGISKCLFTGIAGFDTVSAARTLSNISSIVMANTFVRSFMVYMLTSSLVDCPVVIMTFLVFAKSVFVVAMALVNSKGQGL